jgi:hypothetical protein
MQTHLPPGFLWDLIVSLGLSFLGCERGSNNHDFAMLPGLQVIDEKGLMHYRGPHKCLLFLGRDKEKRVGGSGNILT